jgi:hypothetical protein
MAEGIVVIDLDEPAAEYNGVSTIALGLKILADSPAEANAKLARFADRFAELVKDSRDIEFTKSGRETVIACEQTAIEHRKVERAIRARQARDN